MMMLWYHGHIGGYTFHSFKMNIIQYASMKTATTVKANS